MRDVATIQANIEAVRERIARAAERSGRQESDVSLIAVTKMVPVERIMEAVEAGVTHLGENRVQEAQAKFSRDTDGITFAANHESRFTFHVSRITLHMIGSLQRNKALSAAALFDWVHSVDRTELAVALNGAAGEARNEPLNVLLQVNLTGEPSKSGVTAEELPRLTDSLAGCEHLRGMGLMTIARFGANESELRRTFGGLRRLLEGLQRTHPGEWRHLSMGMSDDYEVAVEEGATMVRLGRVIFGGRK